jgi:hypothetical protein
VRGGWSEQCNGTSSMTPRGIARWILATSPLLVAVLAGACGGNSASSGSSAQPSSGAGIFTGSSGSGGASAGAGSGGVGPDGGPVDGETGRELFESTVQAEMITECNACHRLGGISDQPFLAEPDVYASISSWPGFIVPDPEDNSLLYTHPDTAGHGNGVGAHYTPDLQAKVLTWLNFEAANIPSDQDAGGPQLPIFKPIFNDAINVIYLDPLGPLFVGSSITFTASQLPTCGPVSILDLTQIQVNPTEGITLHIVHPLFTVYPSLGGEEPDPVDSFATLDDTYTQASPSALGTGALVLTNWSQDARLGIDFETIEVLPGPNGGLPCGNPTAFAQDAVPAMQYCAKTCHGGNNTEAHAAMDLSQLNTSPTAACAQVRSHIDTTDLAQSMIFVNTDPNGGAVHMYKFEGSVSHWNDFVNAVTPWIMAEQAQ